MKSFTGPGSTPSRRRFWDQVTETVNASRKIGGRHVTVSEHEGKGTLINVADTSARRAGGGGGCPTTLLIEFNGVTFCACTPNEAGTASFTLVDSAVNPFNGFHSIGFNLGPVAGCTADCAWPIGGSTNIYNVDATIFSTAPDCSGSSSTSTFSVGAITVVLVSGIYHLVAYGPFDCMLFYGTSSDLLTPFANTVMCDPIFTTWDNPAIRCLNLGATRDLNVAASGGTATITLL